MMPIEVGQSYRGVDGRLGYLLRQAYHAMRGEIDAVAREHGITAPQFSILSLLEQEPGLSGAAVARQSMMRAQTANEIIVLLERDGLLERRAHPTDKRRRDVFLTSRGREVLDTVNRKVARIEQQVLDAMPRQQRDALVAGLVRCAEVYSALTPTESPGA
jgi:DNA-binding MarR family transcriptional regulator